MTPWLAAQYVLVLSYLEKHDGNKTKTAEALGISVRTLRYKIKEFGLYQFSGDLTKKGKRK